MFFSLAFYLISLLTHCFVCLGVFRVLWFCYLLCFMIL
ncbi:putative membrane protein [Helicobacter pylori Hp P-30]|nr:putative membrane protein [Helicobacter pylori Hp A-14]EJC49252.1 putative membrane protein [Helicobacter pylori Hp P-30]